VKRFLPLLLLAVVGCAANSTPAARPALEPGAFVTKRIDVWVWSAAPFDQPAMVKYEVSRRYDDAFVLICHGADNGREWVFTPDAPWAVEPVEAGIKRLRRSGVGNRRIVLWCCNPGHYRLSADCGPVTYAGTNVWVVPDRTLLTRIRDTDHGAGNVYEFAEQR
jgi:hypothetical protein